MFKCKPNKLSPPGRNGTVRPRALAAAPPTTPPPGRQERSRIHARERGQRGMDGLEALHEKGSLLGHPQGRGLALPRPEVLKWRQRYRSGEGRGAGMGRGWTIPSPPRGTEE